MRRALLAAFFAVACSTPAGAPAASATAAATGAPIASPAATTSAPSGALAFNVAPGSKATVRVRETLAGFSAPNDAVLETAVTGAFTLNPDGTFDPSSRIVADLSALRSDSGQRDRFIKDQTLDTRRFPNAELTPKRAVGLTLPLPAAGELTFKVEGAMSIHGVTKDVVFDVRATRTPSEVRANANVTPAFKFADFGMEIPRVASVVSIVDEIRLEVEVIAQQR
ncbi:MAG TPA: YceI family protein [Candidatus Limnocylindria bacterium]|nr:YceI family protein [Candidatus Limnocylindria bacterium]